MFWAVHFFQEVIQLDRALSTFWVYPLCLSKLKCNCKQHPLLWWESIPTNATSFFNELHSRVNSILGTYFKEHLCCLLLCLLETETLACFKPNPAETPVSLGSNLANTPTFLKPNPSNPLLPWNQTSRRPYFLETKPSQPPASLESNPANAHSSLNPNLVDAHGPVS